MREIPSRSAVGALGDRCGRDRSLSPARRLARRHRASRCGCRREIALRLDYLQSNIEGGEGYAWYYASDAARSADRARRSPTAPTASRGSSASRTSATGGRTRTMIDRAASRPARRLRGCRKASRSGSPRSAARRSITAPTSRTSSTTRNHPKAASPISPAARATISRSAATLEALLDYWREDGAHNPTSGVYADKMIDMDRAFVWTWDARPYPDFPLRETVWSDGPNWRFGHWIEGRVGAASLSALIAALGRRVRQRHGCSRRSPVLVQGYVIDRPMSPRAAIEPTRRRVPFDAVESEGPHPLPRLFPRERSTARRLVARRARRGEALRADARAGKRDAGRRAHLLHRYRRGIPPGVGRVAQAFGRELAHFGKRAADRPVAERGAGPCRSAASRPHGSAASG